MSRHIETIQIPVKHYYHSSVKSHSVSLIIPCRTDATLTLENHTCNCTRATNMYDVLASRNLIGLFFPLRILKGHASSRAVFLFTYSPNIALQNVFALNAYMVIVVGVNRRKLIKKKIKNMAVLVLLCAIVKTIKHIIQLFVKTHIGCTSSKNIEIIGLIVSEILEKI